MVGWLDGMDGRMDGWTDGGMDGWRDGRMCMYVCMYTLLHTSLISGALSVLRLPSCCLPLVAMKGNDRTSFLPLAVTDAARS